MGSGSTPPPNPLLGTPLATVVYIGRHILTQVVELNVLGLYFVARRTGTDWYVHVQNSCTHENRTCTISENNNHSEPTTQTNQQTNKHA